MAGRFGAGWALAGLKCGTPTGKSRSEFSGVESFEKSKALPFDKSNRVLEDLVERRQVRDGEGDKAERPRAET